MQWRQRTAIGFEFGQHGKRCHRNKAFGRLDAVLVVIDSHPIKMRNSRPTAYSHGRKARAIIVLARKNNEIVVVSRVNNLIEGELIVDATESRQTAFDDFSTNPARCLHIPERDSGVEVSAGVPLALDELAAIVLDTGANRSPAQKNGKLRDFPKT